LAQVLAATQPSPIAPIQNVAPSLSKVPFHDALSPAWLPFSSTFPKVRTDIEEKKESSCQKLLFSATLTRDPSKIAALNLRNAKYFVVGDEGQIRGGDGVDGVVGEAFAFPESLKVCPLALSPLYSH
jgi:ATP-dependent RNA helicase DDX51/DBP6